jgi:hypothetical protein
VAGEYAVLRVRDVFCGGLLGLVGRRDLEAAILAVWAGFISNAGFIALI